MNLNQVKKAILHFIPKNIEQRYWRFVNSRKRKHQDRKEIFSQVYEMHEWGKHKDSIEKYYSGIGSHKEETVNTYVNGVTLFLTSLSQKYAAVDLGCGDFAIGSRLRDCFTNYTACDIVDELIIHNRSKFKHLNVDFKITNIIDDDLPDGDIALIRQVLQHFCNEDIQKVLSKLLKYKYIIVTEHLPLSKTFKPNIDKPTDASIRLEYSIAKSGVVLTKSPFNLKVKNEKIIAQVEDEGGIIQTIVYEL